MSNIYSPGQPGRDPGIQFTAAQQAAEIVPPPILEPRKALDFRNMARLATLPKTGYSPVEDETGRIVIPLPHLPEEIDVGRENTYNQAGNNPIMPDGLWIYQSTNPLELEFVFTLHAFDDLCPEGPKTLLDIAARLHTLLLPANNQTLENTSKVLAAAENINKQASQELGLSAGNQPQGGDAGVSSSSQFNGKLLYPPACSLRLIQAGSRGLGLNCVGFVKSAGVKLHGPYLQTADGANEFNLPSAATYRFTFVHNPVYTNTLKIGKIVQAFGPDVFEYFYNTAHLAPLSQNTYVDVAEVNRG